MEETIVRMVLWVKKAARRRTLELGPMTRYRKDGLQNRFRLEYGQHCCHS